MRSLEEMWCRLVVVFYLQQFLSSRKMEADSSEFRFWGSVFSLVTYEDYIILDRFGYTHLVSDTVDGRNPAITTWYVSANLNWLAGFLPSTVFAPKKNWDDDLPKLESDRDPPLKKVMILVTGYSDTPKNDQTKIWPQKIKVQRSAFP